MVTGMDKYPLPDEALGKLATAALTASLDSNSARAVLVERLRIVYRGLSKPRGVRGGRICENSSRERSKTKNKVSKSEMLDGKVAAEGVRLCMTGERSQVEDGAATQIARVGKAIS